MTRSPFRWFVLAVLVGCGGSRFEALDDGGEDAAGDASADGPASLDAPAGDRSVGLDAGSDGAPRDATTGDAPYEAASHEGAADAPTGADAEDDRRERDAEPRPDATAGDGGERHDAGDAGEGGGLEAGAEGGLEAGAEGGLDASDGGGGEAGVDDASSEAASDAGVEAEACVPITYYLDGDGDGWGGTSTAQGCAPPDSGVWVTRGGDCDDSNLTVNPGQMAYFASGYVPTGKSEVSFDYDCDGSEVESGAAAKEACGFQGLSCVGAGYLPAIPMRSGAGVDPYCGSELAVTCSVVGLSCQAGSPSSASAIACH